MPNGARTAVRANGGQPTARMRRRNKVRRFTDVAFSMARADFKLRYLDSAIGYAWALGQPLLMYAVLYLIWSNVLHVGHGVAHYPLKLLLAIVLFVLHRVHGRHPAVAAVEGHDAAQDPLPAARGAAVDPDHRACSSTRLSLTVVFIFILANGITPGKAWLEMIPLLGAADRLHRRRQPCCSRSPTCTCETSSQCGSSSRGCCSS